MSPRDLSIVAITFVIGGTLAFGASRLLAPGPAPTDSAESASAVEPEPDPDPDCEAALDQADARLQAARADVEGAQDLLDRMRGPIGEPRDTDTDAAGTD